MKLQRECPQDAEPFGRIFVALCGIVSISLIGFVYWLICTVPTAHFVLPAGFNGPFVVASCSERRAIWATNTEYELRVPADGVLVLDDDGVLRRWHNVLVSTADGVLVRVKPNPSNELIEANKVFLSKGLTTSCNFREHWFFIGPPGSKNDPQKEQEIENRLVNYKPDKDRHNP